MKRNAILLFVIFSHHLLLSQKSTTSFIFGHSLINHEFQIDPTPSQETSVPHWMHFLAEHANHQYKVSGQYGFLPQHANLPPFAQWGFDFAEGAWDSDNEPFESADFTNIIITPGNFIQWQGPTENYPTDPISPVGATEAVFNWCIQQEDNLEFYVYENWPDMGGFLGNNFPPNATEWTEYNNYLNGDFHNWFLEYHDILVTSIPDACIKMIPVGPIISHLLDQTPFNQIPIDDLYEDDAPHGKSSIYFLASLITYMATYYEQAPLDYQVDPIIHPIIIDNYSSVVNFIWDELNNFNFDNGDSRVFCNTPTTDLKDHIKITTQVHIKPNPANDYLHIESNFINHEVEIYPIDGHPCVATHQLNATENRINISWLPKGIYLIVGKNELNNIIYRKKLVKI